MRKYTLCPLVALALGCGGAALRMWQESCYTDGFPPAGHLSSLLLIGLCVLAGLLSVLAARGARKFRCGAYFSGSDMPGAALFVLSAAGFLIAAMLHLLQIAAVTGMGPDSSVSPLFILAAAPLELLLAVLAVPTVVCLAFLAKDAKAGKGRTMNSLTVLLPAAYGWVWLIDLYRRSVSNPILWDYIFLMLAVVSLLVAAVGRAGFSFSDGKPFPTVFFGLFGLFLAPIAFLQASDLPARFSLIAMTLYVLAALPGLLKDQPMLTTKIETEESSDE